MQTSFLEPIGPSRIEPVSGYQVIYADPPWAYGQRCTTDSFKGGVRRHYSVMDTGAICALPVEKVAAKSSMLFMWATMPLLPDAFKVIEAWGFSYCTVAFTWVKLNPQDGGVFFGVGYYTKSNAEICLLARKGRAIKPAVNTVSQVIIDTDMRTDADFIPEVILSPRMEHSRKPDEARRRIEQLYPDCSRLEMFARRRSPGWDAFGNEVESDLKLETVK